MADDDILARASDVSWTPPVSAIPALIDALDTTDKKRRKQAMKALLRTKEAGARGLELALESAQGPRRQRVARGLSRYAQDGDRGARETLIALLGDPDEQAQRAAVNAVGQWPDATEQENLNLESELLALWEDSTPLATQRALARTLGRLGGTRSWARLTTVETRDPELGRIVAEAVLVLTRNVSRDETRTGQLDMTAVADRPHRTEARCRRGLERLLAAEVEACGLVVTAHRPGRVNFESKGPLTDFIRPRTSIDAAFTLPPRPLDDYGGDAVEALIDALSSDPAHHLFERFSTQLPVRYRIDWRGAGKRRGATWRVVRAIAARCPYLLNDPSERQFEVIADISDGQNVRVSLRPRLEDTRFAYRVADIPAASHPTLAAALVRISGDDPYPVVWDPFVGSASELIERAFAGGSERLIGTDNEQAALDAGAQNVAAAKVDNVVLEIGDALTYDPGVVDLVLTNPPMGRRVGNTEEVSAMLAMFVARLREILRPGGCLCWIAPFPDVTNPVARDAALRLEFEQPVDMGGFTATLQRWRRRPAIISSG